MMENKLWIALCVLLLMNVGSADHDDTHAAVSTLRSPIGDEVAPIALATDSLPGSSLDQTSHATAASALNGSDTNPRSNGSAARPTETPFVTRQPKKYNDTNTVTSFPENIGTLTGHSTLQPLIPSSESHTTTSHIPPISTAANPTHTTHTALADTSTTTPASNTPHHSAALLPDSITPSSQPTHPKMHSSTSSPTAKLPGVSPTTKPASNNTANSTQSTSTPSTSSSKESPNSQPPTLTPPPNTSQSNSHHEVSEVHPKTTITPPNSTSTQTNAHAKTPSQLNVGDDTTMVHESPTLDPLLAGLVSAFIITAVIITLLLFLKLRRRNNRPEFHRLQDLPMDDMMEDTPLSMYSY